MFKDKIDDRLRIFQRMRMMPGSGLANRHGFAAEFAEPLFQPVAVFLRQHDFIGLRTEQQQRNSGRRHRLDIVQRVDPGGQRFGFGKIPGFQAMGPLLGEAAPAARALAYVGRVSLNNMAFAFGVYGIVSFYDWLPPCLVLSEYSRLCTTALGRFVQALILGVLFLLAVGCSTLLFLALL